MSKILIVEDDPLLVEIYQRKFENEGFDVVTASNGVEAVKKINNFAPNVALLDLVMPKEDGFGVLAKIQKSHGGENIKIIVFSNLSQVEDKEKAEKLGAAGFITKADFTPQEVVEKVRDILKLSAGKTKEAGSSKGDDEMIISRKKL